MCKGTSRQWSKSWQQEVGLASKSYRGAGCGRTVEPNTGGLYLVFELEWNLKSRLAKIQAGRDKIGHSKTPCVPLCERGAMVLLAISD